MLRWLGPRKSSSSASKRVVGGGGGGGGGCGGGGGEGGENGECVTDDPLAVIDTGFAHNRIYSVSRVNPLFVDIGDSSSLPPPPPPPKQQQQQQRETPPSSTSRRRSSSSGYASVEQLGALLERNPAFVRSIAVATGRSHFGGSASVGGANSSSGGGTLTTIPEGRVDLPVPRPIWPDKVYDSLVDDALLLYTSLSHHESGGQNGQRNGGGFGEGYADLPVKDLLLELLNGINETLEGRNGTTPEDMLKAVDEKIRLKLELLRHSTEEEMRRLCVNLGNCKKKNSVLRALSNSSSSGNSSSKSCPASEPEELYQAPSGSSSSGFSDSPPNKGRHTALPDFVGVPNVVRNAMIYGTLCRHKGGAGEGLLAGGGLGGARIGAAAQPKRSLLSRADDKPSVWEQYYGVRAVEEGEVKYHQKPADVPIFPGGRPEADFTLDLPRSEHLMKRMKQDKKWRCRCRLLASFLGLIFFLLSVMAVSLMLTRGKRMFGSMV